MPNDKRKKMEAAAAALKKSSRSYDESLKRVKPASKPKKKKGKLRRTIRELVGGSKTYLPKKSHVTKRTTDTESQLAKAGITQKETAKLRRKK